MDALVQQVKQALPRDLGGTLGVAVSGGGDSVALLLLLQQVSQVRGGKLACVTVDHGLRAESRDEALWVQDLCTRLGISHDILAWQAEDRRGNTQNAARQARYGLMTNWAQDRGIAAIALGHTQDDQAETVMMRLARGAGVDGLCGMAAVRRQNGISLVRPLLGVSRAALRASLQAAGQGWLEDPSNEDPQYDRIKMRRILQELTPLGLDAEHLAQVAHNMQSAQAVLDAQTKAAAITCAKARAGAVVLERAAFDALPIEIARRLMLAALKWVSGAVYAPRNRSLTAAMDGLRNTDSATLEGCHLIAKGPQIWVCREFNVVRDLRADPGALWDGRWLLSGPQMPPGSFVAALGARGLAACPDWRAQGLPRALLLAAPALWHGEVLLAAPHAGKADNEQAILKNGETSFYDSIIAH